MKKVIVLCILFTLCGVNAYNEFDTLMQYDQYAHVLMRSNVYASWYSVFKRLYEEYQPERVAICKETKIPHVMHFIWLGGVVPEEYKGYQQSWYNLHPTWQIVWWTDTPEQFKVDTICTSFEHVSDCLEKKDRFIVVDTRNLSFDNRCFYDQADNFGEKSDILRWEVVYRFGGMYVDIDCQALKPFDSLHQRYDFYTGVQPLDTNIVQLGAALFGARKYHPIMRACIEGIKKNQHIDQIVLKTGPIHFTVSCIKALTDDFTACGTVVALPAAYFYPCGYTQRNKSEQIWHKPESFAVHHWAGSWLKPEAFEK